MLLINLRCTHLHKRPISWYYLIGVCLILLCHFTTSSAQVRKSKKADVCASCCQINPNVSKVILREQYPFCSTCKILLVSYTSADHSVIKDLESLIRVTKDTLGYKYLREISEIPNNQVDTLANIMFGFAFKPYSGVRPLYSCYDPKNGILFLNNKNQIVARIDICFECYRTHMVPDSLKIDMCNEKFKMLIEFFRGNSVKHGVQKK